MDRARVKKQKDAMRIIRGITLTVGLLLLTLTAYFTYDRVNFFLTAERVEGAIVGVSAVVSEETTNRGGGEFKRSRTTYAPIISFTTKDGINIEFKAAFSSSNKSYEYREKIDVLYLASNPSKARTNTFIELWLPLIILFVFTIISILCGLPTKEKNKAR